MVNQTAISSNLPISQISFMYVQLYKHTMVHEGPFYSINQAPMGVQALE